jgi:hypothetical protein
MHSGAWQLPNSLSVAQNPEAHRRAPPEDPPGPSDCKRFPAAPTDQTRSPARASSGVGCIRFAKEEPGAGDETRTRDFNLGNKDVRRRIQAAV